MGVVEYREKSWRNVSFNPGALKLFELSAPPATGLTLAELGVSTPLQKFWAALYPRARGTGSTMTTERPHAEKQRDYLISVVPLGRPGGHDRCCFSSRTSSSENQRVPRFLKGVACGPSASSSAASPTNSTISSPRFCSRPTCSRPSGAASLRSSANCKSSTIPRGARPISRADSLRLVAAPRCAPPLSRCPPSSMEIQVTPPDHRSLHRAGGRARHRPPGALPALRSRTANPPQRPAERPRHPRR